ncbi:POC1 centriolar protein A [Pleurotus ostreatus]|uniref:POC1 centriolar protein A n=1 Tax=Pleurotus ostreatus TaxID=5322 RepID=A0A8H6ZR22_PLEOS|nr:POC1 centriolar protein A [Pleurotus ostreatus]KAF7421161.1 POC1 centriolar protein A [Pleurotus ostreatus]
MGDIHLILVVQKATGLGCKSTLRSKPNGYVTINWVLGSRPQEHRTQVVKSTTSPLWEESFRLFSQSMDSTITFEMFDKGFGSSHSYGTVQKTVMPMTPRLIDISFPLGDAILSIRVEKEDTDSALSDTLADAQRATRDFAKAPNQTKVTTSAYTSLGGVVDSLSKLMEIADSAAQIHPYINVAWKTVSSVYKVVKNQLDRDEAICDLLETMAILYGFTVPLEVMRRDHTELDSTLVDVIKQILQQTIECSLFVQEYSGKGFAGRSIKHTFSTTDERVRTFKAAFISLGNSLDMGLSVQNALVSIRIASDVQDLALRSKLNPAEMEWTGRPTCHPRTRLDMLRTITEWIIDPKAKSRVLWITGLAGAGKSTLATTVANMYAENGRLGAFVFFDRDVKERSDPTNFLRTLAYELSRCDVRIAKGIKGAVDMNSRIAQMQLDAQFKDLVRMPLFQAASDTAEGQSLADEGPVVIVIDSLDECGNESTRKQLLKILAKETAKLPKIVRVIITSRSEPDIVGAFSKESHIKHHELEVLPHDGDISVYIQSQFKEIEEKNYFDEGWPAPDKLRRLVSRAGGLFIWASTACRYIDCYDPDAALEDLLQGEGFHEGLDDLYSKALRGAGDWKSPKFKDEFQSIVGTISVAKNPITTETIDKFLKTKVPSKRLLSRFASVIHQADNEPVRILHKSFSEFISSLARCVEPMYFINVSDHEHRAAVNCIAQMEVMFKRPRLFTPGAILKLDYDEAVTYSCSYWIHHVIAVEDGSDRTKLALTVYDFMKVHTLHWLEATSILKTSRSTPSILEQLYQWAMDVGMDDMTSLAYDAYRFATFFAETIAEHPALITQVALPFVPLESKLYQLFHDHRELPTVMGGYQQKWSPSLRVFPILDTSVICVSFSPDMTKVVSTGARFDDDAPINGDENNCVRCWDVATGTEAMPSVELEYTSIAQFSSDGAQVWVATGQGSVYVLDAGTGDRLSTLIWNQWLKKPEHSPDVSRSPSPSLRSWRSSDAGSNLGSAPRSRAPSRPPSSMHHTMSLDTGIPQSHGLEQSEANAETSDSDSAQSSPRATSLPMDPTDPGDVASDLNVEGGFTRAAFSNDGKWVIFGDDSGELYVIDREARKQTYDTLDDCSRLEWREVVRMFPSIVFSPDNEVFAAGAGDGKIHIWRTESGEKFLELEGHTKEIILLAFSPEGDKLYSASEDGNVRTWDPVYGDAVGSVTIDIRGITKFQPMAFSPDGRMASTSTDGTIQIWDASTGEEVGPVLQGHFNAVSSMTFSQDGSKLVSGAFKNNIQTWDVSGKDELTRFSRHDRPPHKVIFSPSGLIVRSSRPNETKFWSSVTGRELKMDPYDMSATFIKDIAEDDENDEELASKIKEYKEKYSDAPDTLVTSSGDIVTLVDSLPDSELSGLEKEWQAAIEGSNPRDLTWKYTDSRIVYHHPKTIIDDDDDGVVKYETDGQEIWRLPLEFRHRSNDIRPNFITFGIWNGRVFVMHLPQKLVTRNATV